MSGRFPILQTYKHFQVLMLAIVSVLIFGTVANSQTAKSAARNAPAAETQEIVITQHEVVAALKVVPNARAYVDNYGEFNYKKARIKLGALKAKVLRNKWNEALSEATRKA